MNEILKSAWEKAGEEIFPDIEPEKRLAKLLGHTGGMAFGYFFYRRLGAPKWAAYAISVLVSSQTRQGEIARAIYRKD